MLGSETFNMKDFTDRKHSPKIIADIHGPSPKENNDSLSIESPVILIAKDRPAVLRESSDRA